MTVPPLPPPPVPPLTARVRLSPPEGGPRLIDGAWWPRGNDLVTELPPLLSALPESWHPIVHVTVNALSWSPFPGHMLHEGRILQLHHTHSPHSPDTVCLMAPGWGRWDLLLVPPGAKKWPGDA
ncbi:DUF5994 family protein [Streptomyces sp. NPDC001941]|uniref:DUF5994 family protein n=1 Tax=Streptomyces sp. NPDC001941 TaxID=3154659 RepID=UPI003319177D